MRSGITLRQLGLCALLLSLIMISVGCQPSESTPSPTTSSSTTSTSDDVSEPAAEDTAVDSVAEFEVPAGLPALEVPEDNPMTPAKVELGKYLFF